jgi:putative heme-binding domain-containing protein
VAIATLERLKGNDASKKDAAFADLMTLLGDASKPASLRAMALRILPTDSDWLTTERLYALSTSEDATLRREAIRSLAAGSHKDRFAALAAIAIDAGRTPSERADAVAGLAADRKAQGELLKKLSNSADDVVAHEAQLALAETPATRSSIPPADDLDAWRKAVGNGGDADAGWRVFFRSNGAACSRCHMLDGRGGNIGPDLTGIGRRMDRDRLLESILQPSKEVAPQYVPWTIVTTDGHVKTGLPIDVRDTGATYEQFVGSDGIPVTLQSADIDSRHASDQSIMPDGLEKLLTPKELRDLLAILVEG